MSVVEGPVDSAETGGGTTVVPGGIKNGDKEPEKPEVSNETAEAQQGGFPLGQAL